MYTLWSYEFLSLSLYKVADSETTWALAGKYLAANEIKTIFKIKAIIIFFIKLIFGQNKSGVPKGTPSYNSNANIR